MHDDGLNLPAEHEAIITTVAAAKASAKEHANKNEDTIVKMRMDQACLGGHARQTRSLPCPRACP